MLRSIVLSILLGSAVMAIPTTPVTADTTPPQTCCGYWVARTQPDAEKRYSMSNTFRGYQCVAYDRQMADYFYRTTGTSRSMKVDVVCRGSKEDADRMRKDVIRAQGEPASSWSVPDVPNLK